MTLRIHFCLPIQFITYVNFSARRILKFSNDLTLLILFSIVEGK